MARIDAFLKLGAAQGCSDVHLAVGVPPMLRMNGDLMPIKFRDLRRRRARGLRRPRSSRDIAAGAVPQGQRPRLLLRVRRRRPLPRQRVPQGHRRRRDVPRPSRADVPTLDTLALPPIVKKLCDFHQGMVLVTGSTGTGKSTTLAAMIDHLNTTRAAQHHQPRGPDRVRPPQQAAPGHPARARHAHARRSPKACARPCAKTPT